MTLKKHKSALGSVAGPDSPTAGRGTRPQSVGRLSICATGRMPEKSQLEKGHPANRRTASRRVDCRRDRLEDATVTTSLVSYPNRCNLWGDARFRGNCDGRLFRDLVIRYDAKNVADPMMGSGTTRDVIDWLNRQHQAGTGYWGADLASGFNLLTTDLPGRYDFVWLHPPYWDIIQYHPDDPRDLSSFKSYEQFTQALGVCLVRCARALTPGGHLAVLVGDVRRQGRYYPLVRELLGMAPRLGELRSVIVKAQHNCKSDSKEYGTLEDVPIKHEYCVVFKKPVNRRPATAASEHGPETASRREKMETENKQQPTAEIRIGRLKATVWANTSTSSDVPWHNTQLCRIFKPDGQGTWHESTNFGRDDLLALAELLRETYRWIAEHEGRLSIKAGQGEPDNGNE